MSDFDWLPTHVERGTEAKESSGLVIMLKLAAILVVGGLIVLAAVYLADWI